MGLSDIEHADLLDSVDLLNKQEKRFKDKQEKRFKGINHCGSCQFCITYISFFTEDIEK